MATTTTNAATTAAARDEAQSAIATADDLWNAAALAVLGYFGYQAFQEPPYDGFSMDVTMTRAAGVFEYLKKFKVTKVEKEWQAQGLALAKELISILGNDGKFKVQAEGVMTCLNEVIVDMSRGDPAVVQSSPFCATLFRLHQQCREYNRLNPGGGGGGGSAVTLKQLDELELPQQPQGSQRVGFFSRAVPNPSLLYNIQLQKVGADTLRNMHGLASQRRSYGNNFGLVAALRALPIAKFAKDYKNNTATARAEEERAAADAASGAAAGTGGGSATSADGGGSAASAAASRAWSSTADDGGSAAKGSVSIELAPWRDRH